MRQSFPDRVSQEDVVRPPGECPACHSKDLTTASKTITLASYWRCLTCGEVWNQERLGAANRYWPRRGSR